MKPLWCVKTDKESVIDREPHRVSGNIKYIERYINDFTYRIYMQDYLKFPFIKTTKLDRSIVERIVGVYIVPKMNKFYNTAMDANDKLIILNIKEDNEMKYKNRLIDQTKKANEAEHINWFSINPVRARYYRVEIHVDPSTNNFHLESTEVKEMKEDGFSQ